MAGIEISALARHDSDKANAQVIKAAASGYELFEI